MKLVPGVQSVCRKDPFELGGFQVADAAGQVAAGAGAAAAAADGAAGGLLIIAAVEFCCLPFDDDA